MAYSQDSIKREGGGEEVFFGLEILTVLFRDILV